MLNISSAKQSDGGHGKQQFSNVSGRYLKMARQNPTLHVHLESLNTAAISFRFFLKKKGLSPVMSLDKTKKFVCVFWGGGGLW